MILTRTTSSSTNKNSQQKKRSRKFASLHLRAAQLSFPYPPSTTNQPITMAPNADTSILRNRITTKVKAGDILSEDAATQPTLRSLKHLRGNEVAINGTIYDITNFVHPGGEVIEFFGGNDVTVQYTMIHPYHTSKHLEKMKAVGKLVDYVSE